jgi:DNA-3-methyladenine glycosylase
VAYVYFVYGMHFCFNVVCEAEDYPGAVLVRAIESLDNLPPQRTNGPALVCRALAIDRTCNNLDLVTSNLYLLDAASIPDQRVRVGPRIGVDYAGDWASHPYRFWLADSPSVSRPRITGTTFSPAMLR